MVQAELEIFRRRSREATGAAEKIADELRRAFVESSTFVVEPAGAKEVIPAAVAAVTPEATANVQPVELPDVKPAMEIKAEAATGRKPMALSAKVPVADLT